MNENRSRVSSSQFKTNQISDSEIKKSKRKAMVNFPDFWLKNDFLNLQIFVSERILKIYYSVFYATVVLFILIMMALLFPIDWSDNSKINILMYKIDQWQKYQSVDLLETQFDRSQFLLELQRSV